MTPRGGCHPSASTGRHGGIASGSCEAFTRRRDDVTMRRCDDFFIVHLTRRAGILLCS
ncbi:hypothetical protein E4U53_006692, partial [Claviceps sorghi]